MSESTGHDISVFFMKNAQHCHLYSCKVYSLNKKKKITSENNVKQMVKNRAMRHGCRDYLSFAELITYLCSLVSVREIALDESQHLYQSNQLLVYKEGGWGSGYRKNTYVYIVNINIINLHIHVGTMHICEKMWFIKKVETRRFLS